MADGLNWSVLQRAGVRQSDLATILKVSRVATNGWVRGRFSPNPRRGAVLVRLLAAMELAIADDQLPAMPGPQYEQQLRRILANYLRKLDTQ